MMGYTYKETDHFNDPFLKDDDHSRGDDEEEMTMGYVKKRRLCQRDLPPLCLLSTVTMHWSS